MTNAFLVIIIMISIYSLVAVEFFSSFGTVRNDEFYDASLREPAAAAGGGGDDGVSLAHHTFDPTVSTLDAAGFTHVAAHTNIGTGQPSNSFASNATDRTPPPECAYLNVVGIVVPSASARELCIGAEYCACHSRCELDPSYDCCRCV